MPTRLSEEQRDFFEANGYLIVPNVLNNGSGALLVMQIRARKMRGFLDRFKATNLHIGARCFLENRQERAIRPKTSSITKSAPEPK